MKTARAPDFDILLCYCLLEDDEWDILVEVISSVTYFAS